MGGEVVITLDSVEKLQGAGDQTLRISGELNCGSNSVVAASAAAAVPLLQAIADQQAAENEGEGGDDTD